MRIGWYAFAAYAVGALLVAAPVRAQARASLPFEIGFDGSIGQRKITFAGSTSAETENFVQLPVSAVRFGMFVNPLLELEPSVAYQRVGTADDTFSQLGLSLGLPIYFTPQRTKVQAFIRPVVGVIRSSDSHSATVSQTTVGGGIGLKVPIDRRLATRFELQYLRANGHHDDVGSPPGYNQIALLIGFSAYTR